MPFLPNNDECHIRVIVALGPILCSRIAFKVGFVCLRRVVIVIQTPLNGKGETQSAKEWVDSPDLCRQRKEDVWKGVCIPQREREARIPFIPPFLLFFLHLIVLLLYNLIVVPLFSFMLHLLLVAPSLLSSKESQTNDLTIDKVVKLATAPLRIHLFGK